MKRRRDERGYALLVILLMGALVMISLSAAVPRLLTQGQREREKELIFRGEQYERAVRLFYRQFGRYPNSIDELLEANDRAFLRRAWPDPMTSHGEWRFIRVGPNGQFVGSIHRPLSGEGEDSDRMLGNVEDFPIAGVASQNRDWSIKVYDESERYIEWEFIYEPGEEALGEPSPRPGGSSEGSADRGGDSES